jgi:hypothetical protein
VFVVGRGRGRGARGGCGRIFGQASGAVFGTLDFALVAFGIENRFVGPFLAEGFGAGFERGAFWFEGLRFARTESLAAPAAAGEASVMHRQLIMTAIEVDALEQAHGDQRAQH